MHDIRQLIIIVEAMNPVDRRTLRHKPFDSITEREVLNALFDVSDLRTVVSEHWDQMDWGEDAEGEPLDSPPIPKSSANVAANQWPVIEAFYAEGAFYDSRKGVSEFAAMDTIPVVRRLNRLSDLSGDLGVHWTAGSESYEWLKGYGGIVLTADVDNRCVDWITTLARAMFWWFNEREITICAGSPIALKSMTFSPGTTGKA